MVKGDKKVGSGKWEVGNEKMGSEKWKMKK